MLCVVLTNQAIQLMSCQALCMSYSIDEEQIWEDHCIGWGEGNESSSNKGWGQEHGSSSDRGRERD